MLAKSNDDFKLKSDLFIYRFLDLDRKKREAGADLNFVI